MPLRRRPTEPSARLRALLASTERRAAPGAEVVEALESVEVVAVPAIESTPPAMEPWLPARPTPVGERPAAGPGRHRRPAPPPPRFLTLPAALRGARVTGSRAAAVGLIVVVVLSAVGFGVRVAWARAASTPHVVAPARSGSAVATGGPGASAFASSATGSGGGGPPTATSTVTVHVVGQVAKPGLLRLPAGSRVADAVARAGGATRGADLAAINLARPLVDGEQVRVPKPGEALAPGGLAGAANVPGTAAGGGPGAGGGAGGASALVNLNSASTTQLEDLPGVGPVLAQRIVDWRTEHGRFASVDELGEVSGIGEKIFAQLRPKVTV